MFEIQAGGQSAKSAPEGPRRDGAEGLAIVIIPVLHQRAAKLPVFH